MVRCPVCGSDNVIGHTTGPKNTFFECADCRQRTIDSVRMAQCSQCGTDLVHDLFPIRKEGEEWVAFYVYMKSVCPECAHEEEWML